MIAKIFAAIPHQVTSKFYGCGAPLLLGVCGLRCAGGGDRPGGGHFHVLAVPEREEHVIPPLSHFEIFKVRRRGPINCYVLRLNLNLRAFSLEELCASRKTSWPASSAASRLTLRRRGFLVPGCTRCRTVASGEESDVREERRGTGSETAAEEEEEEGGERLLVVKVCIVISNTKPPPPPDPNTSAFYIALILCLL